MEIIIAGGTGFIGQALVAHYKDNNQLTVIGRDQKKIHSFFNTSVQALTWDSFAKNPRENIEKADLIINLSGANIGEKRWTKQRKAELLNSRIETTKLLANACATLGSSSPPLFNASAVGVYGLQASIKHGLPPAYTEESPIDFYHYPDFLSEIGRKWEAATHPAAEASVHVVNMRFGVVLDKSGGVLKKLVMPFRLFIGGKIGNGQQPFPWICLQDLIRAIDFLQQNPSIKGPVNFVAPEGITQAELASAIGKALHRPSFMTTPAFALKTVFGEMANELLLNGQHVKPSVLLANGFQFKYPEINKALQMIFQE